MIMSAAKRLGGIQVLAVMLLLGVMAMWLAPVKPVFLLTDILVYVLTAALLGLFTYIKNREHLIAPWRHVVRRPLAASSLVVLSVYLAVGFLDSVHFRNVLDTQSGGDERHYSVEVNSVLDVLLQPLKSRTEKTYSAPLATHLFSREIIELADGRTLRGYPRLQYGGAHLGNPQQQWAGDIVMRSLRALAYGIVVSGLIIGLFCLYQSRRHRIHSRLFMQQLMKGKTELPWRAIFAVITSLLILIALIFELGIAYHLLGTDKVGNDVLYLSLKSIRTGLVIGTLTTLIMLPFAILLGIMAGHFRGWVDDVIQYLYTTLSSIPGVLLIAAAILSVDLYISNNPELFETVVERADLRLLFLCMILGITSWTGLCRLLRGETLKLREMDYIQAATAFGVGDMKIISRHILPNVMHIVLIAIVLDFSSLVLAEAVLSYVGVGVDPSMISWGNMINGARLEMAREPVVWWSLVAAFWFMFMLVLAANLFSDAVRDAFDPRVSRTQA